jgi:uncharacterized protein (TIRG00374 family)
LTGGLQLFTRGSIAVFAGTMVFAAVALPRPETVIRWLQTALRWIPRWGARLAASRAIGGIEQLLRDYSRLVRHAVRRGKLAVLAIFLLSALIYLNKFLVAYVVLWGLGLQAPFAEVLHLQALQSLVTYFAPTPGASGVAEVTAAELMAPMVPAASLAAYIVLWRTMSLYLGMAMGAVTVIHSGFTTLRAPAPPPRGEGRDE